MPTTPKRKVKAEPEKAPKKSEPQVAEKVQNQSVIGRPTKRTPEVEAKLIEALSNGATRVAACAYAGITTDTMLNWEKTFSAFSASLTRATGLAEYGFTCVLKECAMEGDWRAAESWLKRRRRDEWGDNINVDVDKRIAELLAELGYGNQDQVPPRS